MEIKVIDSHTGGEPTRVIVDGWPEVSGQNMQERLAYVKEHHDSIRSAVVCEPRGHDAIVGALLTPPVNPGSLAGVIFFNDVGFLGMCGHATIGLMETFRHMGKLNGGEVFIDTPVGTVKADIDGQARVTVTNVSSKVYRQDVEVDVPGLGKVVGDVAYGGNWFYLVNSFSPEISLDNIDSLMLNSKAIRKVLEDKGIKGDDGHLIDHIEFFTKPDHEKAHSKNFVLCPGNAYDRSPCGTGSSAKLACLYERGLIQIGETWLQESICGSIFKCRLEMVGGELLPLISSKAFVTSSATLFLNKEDPFCWGIA